MKHKNKQKFNIILNLLLLIIITKQQPASPTVQKQFHFSLIAVAISDSDGTLVIVGQNGYCMIGSLASTFIQKQFVDTVLTDVKIAPGGSKFITAGNQEKIYVCNMDGTLITTLIQGHSQQIQTLAFSQNGNFIASGSADTTIVVWNNSNYSKLQVIQEHTDSVNSIQYTHDSAFIISGSTDQTIKIIQVSDYSVLQSVDVGTTILKLQIFLDDSKFITANQDFNIRIYDPSDGSLLQDISVVLEEDLALGLSLDGSYIISHTYNKKFKLWDTSNGDLIKTIEDSTHTDIITQMICDANGNILTISRDRYIKQWVLQEIIDSVEQDPDVVDGEDNNTNFKPLQKPNTDQDKNYSSKHTFNILQLIILAIIQLIAILVSI